MGHDSVQHQPFVLNRKPLRYILIYGDDENRTAGKFVWSILADPDVKLENINNIQELKEKFSDSISTFVVIGPNGENAELIKEIGSNLDMIGDIYALAIDAETPQRQVYMGMGYDWVVNRQIMEDLNFKTILLKKTEKAKHRQVNLIMQEEYRRFRAALAASPDAFLVLDSEKRIFFVSEHYRRAYPNVGRHLIRGLPIDEAFEMGYVEQGIKPDSKEYRMLKKFWEDLHGYVEFTMEDGRTWRIKAAPLSEDQGTIITTTDVTQILADKKEIEEKSVQLAEALRKEQEASNLQKQFIGMVSHEFRTPLAIIDGHAQMILRPGTQDPEQIKSRCKTIRSAVSRLVHMMESVLSSNMLKTGRMDPDPELFDLGDLLQELCDEQAELFKPEAISCDVRGLKTKVRLDRKMMTLIVTNLLSNAVKFSSANPEIKVTGTLSGDVIKITVSDNGIGIPENELPKIFDQYYRASTSTGIPGSGIGLHLVRSLMAVQHGEIEVKSRMGHGTEFVLHLQNLN